MCIHIVAITLLLRRIETDIQISGPQNVRHLAMSGNVLYQHHEWEEHIYSFNKEQDRKKMTSMHIYIFRSTCTIANFRIHNSSAILFSSSTVGNT